MDDTVKRYSADKLDQLRRGIIPDEDVKENIPKTEKSKYTGPLKGKKK